MRDKNELFKPIADISPILFDLFISVLCLSIQPSSSKKKKKYN